MDAWQGPKKMGLDVFENLEKEFSLKLDNPQVQARDGFDGPDKVVDRRTAVG
jgi:hypothetical protein